ncbi:MAG: acyl-CoA dehydrogenase family protein, partial [Pseudomonadota bacterium]
WHNSATYKMPMIPVLGLTAASPAVGAAAKAVNLFRQRLQGRTVYGTTAKQSDKPLAQARLGHAQVEVDSIRQQLLYTAKEVSQWGETNEPCPDQEVARLRLQIAHIVARSRNVVRDVVEACGASAHFLDNPLQRAQRDLNTLSCHTFFDMDVSSEMYGRLLLDVESNTR